MKWSEMPQLDRALKKMVDELRHIEIAADMYGYPLSEDSRYKWLQNYTLACVAGRFNPDLDRALTLFKEILVEIAEGW